MLSGCEIGDKKYNTNHMHPKMRAHEILNLQEKLSHLEKECRLVSVLHRGSGRVFSGFGI